MLFTPIDLKLRTRAPILPVSLFYSANCTMVQTTLLYRGYRVQTVLSYPARRRQVVCFAFEKTILLDCLLAWAMSLLMQPAFGQADRTSQWQYDHGRTAKWSRNRNRASPYEARRLYENAAGAQELRIIVAPVGSSAFLFFRHAACSDAHRGPASSALRLLGCRADRKAA